MKINKSTKISKVVGANPKAVEILFKAGLTCIGCPMAQQETLEQGCKAHGMNKKEIKKIKNSFHRLRQS